MRAPCAHLSARSSDLREAVIIGLIRLTRTGNPSNRVKVDFRGITPMSNCACDEPESAFSFPRWTSERCLSKSWGSGGKPPARWDRRAMRRRVRVSVAANLGAIFVATGSARCPHSVRHKLPQRLVKGICGEQNAIKKWCHFGCESGTVSARDRQPISRRATVGRKTVLAKLMQALFPLRRSQECGKMIKRS